MVSWAIGALFGADRYTVQNSAAIHSGAIRSDSVCRYVVRLSVYLSVCSSVRQSTCRSVCLSVCRSVSLPIGLSVRLFVRQSACRSVCPYIRRSVSPPAGVTVDTLVSLSVCRSVCSSAISPSVSLSVRIWRHNILNSFSLGYSIRTLTSVVLLASELWPKQISRWVDVKGEFCATE